MAMYGYVRCSTDKQMVLQQMDMLRAAGCHRIILDKAVKATAKNRRGLQRTRKLLQFGDTFAVTAIDRAFRSTFEAIAFLDDIQADGITFKSVVQQIDTRTPEGRKWYIDLANNAEYERAVIGRRTREQMAAAKKRGKKFGRPLKLTRARIRTLRKSVRNRGGKSMDQIARRHRISRSSLYRAMRD